MKKIVVLMTILLLTSCVSSSDVLKIQEGKYRVVAHSEFSPTYSQSEAFKKGQKHCESKNKSIKAISESERTTTDSFGDIIHVYELNFTCVNKKE